MFSLVKSLFVTDVSIYLETARQVFRYFILAGILSFRVLGLSLAWFHSLILFGLFQVFLGSERWKRKLLYRLHDQLDSHKNKRAF